MSTSQDGIMISISTLLQRAQEEHCLTKTELSAFLLNNLIVPTSIFTSSLSPLQALVLHLTSLQFTIPDIAALLDRHQQSVWSSLKQAKKKKLSLPKKKSTHFIPITSFQSTDLSVLETVVWHLHTHHLSVNEIATLLKRSPQTIYTTLHNAQIKHGTR